MTTRRERIESVGYDYASRGRRPIEHCNVCQSASLARVTETDRYGYAASASGCKRCSLVFLDPQMDNDGYSDFYAKWYRPIVSAYHDREINAETLPADQRRYADSLSEWLSSQFSAQSSAQLGGAKIDTLLDVGGSTGIVAAALRDAIGAQGTVIDPSPEELEVAAGLGLETAAGFVEDFEPAAGTRFDLVVLCQTADHLLDVASALRKIRQLVSDEGWFFVDIVDYQTVAANKGGIVEAIKVDHPYYFSDVTVRCALARAGFEVVATRDAEDQHLDYLCRPCAPQPDTLPAQADVDTAWQRLLELGALA